MKKYDCNVYRFLPYTNSVFFKKLLPYHRTLLRLKNEALHFSLATCLDMEILQLLTLVNIVNIPFPKELIALLASIFSRLARATKTMLLG